MKHPSFNKRVFPLIFFLYISLLLAAAVLNDVIFYSTNSVLLVISINHSVSKNLR